MLAVILGVIVSGTVVTLVITLGVQALNIFIKRVEV
jgi:hypothetical protein